MINNRPKEQFHNKFDSVNFNKVNFFGADEDEERDDETANIFNRISALQLVSLAQNTDENEGNDPIIPRDTSKISPLFKKAVKVKNPRLCLQLSNNSHKGNVDRDSKIPNSITDANNTLPFKYNILKNFNDLMRRSKSIYTTKKTIWDPDCNSETSNLGSEKITETTTRQRLENFRHLYSPTLINNGDGDDYEDKGGSNNNFIRVSSMENPCKMYSIDNSYNLKSSKNQNEDLISKFHSSPMPALIENYNSNSSLNKIVTDHDSLGESTQKRQSFKDYEQSNIMNQVFIPNDADRLLKYPSEQHVGMNSYALQKTPLFMRNTSINNDIVTSTIPPNQLYLDIVHRSIRIVMNLFLVSGVLYTLWSILCAIRSDIQSKVQMHKQKVKGEISHCMKNYQDNNCYLTDRLPYLDQPCFEWERCMNIDPDMTGELSNLSAKILGEVLNTFCQELHWRTVIMICVLFISLAVGLNLVFTLNPYHSRQSLCSEKSNCSVDNYDRKSLKKINERMLTTKDCSLEDQKISKSY